MRWACILFPQLALDAVLRTRADSDAPLVLLSGPTQRRVLQTMNSAARELGLRPGQSLTAAQAITNTFAMAEYEPAEIERWHQFLAAWAYRFSSHVSLHYPRAVLMEVQSSYSLFGPWPRFESLLRKELTELGFQHRIVVAPNAAAARALVNCHDGLAVDEAQLQKMLAQHPVDRLGLERSAAIAFSRMGIRNLEQILRLPRDSIARRFSKEVLMHIDTLLGARQLALACYAPPDYFDSRIELNFEVESHQALLFPLRRLTADLAAYLAGRDSGVQRFTLHMEHRDREDTLLPIGLLNTEREATMLFELVRGRLEQVQLPEPVLALRLIARDLPVFVPERRELFSERAHQSLPWEQLRERLRARLGDDAVTGLHIQADHRPERAWQTSNEIAQVASPTNQRLRPAWLLDEPVISEFAGSQILAGPERIESGWWDGGDIRRDYYLLRTQSGQLAWAYRPVGDSGPLMLHGWFA
ncbi:DNA polymerase Y family protein [Pseudomonas sp. OIL-1]|uniref:Y-family DNA polymerase n=1 Tax=Pseudomonas sp. OIL-1 TaxID=2706126 RepID=UPI0013A71211|nr:DNA polymerase Y family protein [Pseudomonas sp. OIL-1]QIB51160.1 DNA polymerase Y family protein [Pseudomonas sp. OIL-1]